MNTILKRVDAILERQGWIDNVTFLKDQRHHVLFKNVYEMRLKGEEVYPNQDNILKALELTHFDAVQVIILGQDPYHGQGQATGLAFSVNENMPIPPSLRNIFKEIKNDYNLENYCGSANLERWAKQGIFLLNTILTVEAHKAHSHKDMGWQELTSAVLKSLGQRSKPLAVLLWGNAAKQFEPMFLGNEHLILTAPHPSPLSACKGFFGCKHFSKLNAWLVKQEKPMIKW